MRNSYEIRGDVAYITIDEDLGLQTIVDANVIPRLLAELGNTTITFGMSVGPRWCYAQMRHKGKRLSLHRFLTNAPKYLYVDHINHNTLDNRSCNLQLVTPRENAIKKRNIHYDWHDLLEPLAEKKKSEREKKRNRKKKKAPKEKVELEVVQRRKGKMTIFNVVKKKVKVN